MKNINTVAVLCLTLIFMGLSACEGPMGPAGPAGPIGLTGQQGIPGLDGPGTRLVLLTTVGNDGDAIVSLPVEAGTDENDPPSLTCYYGEDGVWLFVSDNTTYCALVFIDNHFEALL